MVVLVLAAPSVATSIATSPMTRRSRVPRCSTAEEQQTEQQQEQADQASKKKASATSIEKELSKAVKKTASTFAPRSSTAKKNPAVPGSTLYTVFEVQAYASMALGGLLSFNLLLPSDEPDLWRLMGMWSVWMFTIPSLRARDCSSKEKEALNYLFLALPLINIAVPFVWRSFPAVWSADVAAFAAIYAWKMEWLGQRRDGSSDKMD